MTNLAAVPSWDDVAQLEDDTIALAGMGEPMNWQAQALANRLEMLKKSLTVDNLAALRLIDSSKFNRAFVLFHDATGGASKGRSFWMDPDDTVSSDNDSTIVVGADGARWKASIGSTITVAEFGASAGGTVGATNPFIAALAEASAIAGGTPSTYDRVGPVVVDMLGRKFALEDQITIPEGVVLANGQLIPIGWSRPSTDPMIVMNGEGSGLIGVNIDQSWTAGGVLRSAAHRSIIDRCHIQRFKGFGVKDTGGTQEAIMQNTVIKQFRYGDPGWTTWANRDAPGLIVNTADCIYDKNVIANSKYGILLDTAVLNMFSGHHIYCGGTEVADIPNIMLVNSGQNQFTHTYCDAGNIRMEDGFNNTFNATLFQQTTGSNNTKGFILSTSAANADASGLVINGVYVESHSIDPLTFVTSGSGSWVTDKKLIWNAAAYKDGTPAYRMAQWLDKGVFDGSGRMIIGSTATTYSAGFSPRLQVVGGTQDGAAANIFKYGNDTIPPSFTLAKSRGAAVGNYSVIKAGDEIGKLQFAGDNGSNIQTVGAYVRAYATYNWSGTEAPTEIDFATTPAGSLTPVIRWKLLGNGNLYPASHQSYDIGLAGTNEVKSVNSQFVSCSETIFLTPGAFTDDAAATSGGIPAYGLYRCTDGTVRWRRP